MVKSKKISPEKKTKPNQRKKPQAVPKRKSVASEKKRVSQKKRLKKADRHPRKKKPRQQIGKQFLVILGSAILLTGLIIWLLVIFLFPIAKIDGYGMMPTLSKHDIVFVNRFRSIKRFKLAYIKLPNGQGTSILRIVGLPGEQIEYVQDQLYVNHEMKEEPFILVGKKQAADKESLFTENFTLSQEFREATIPLGKYLVLGDNRPYATDSRYYGFIDEKDILGIVEMRVLPLHKMEHVD